MSEPRRISDELNSNLYPQPASYFDSEVNVVDRDMIPITHPEGSIANLRLVIPAVNSGGDNAVRNVDQATDSPVCVVVSDTIFIPGEGGQEEVKIKIPPPASSEQLNCTATQDTEIVESYDSDNADTSKEQAIEVVESYGSDSAYTSKEETTEVESNTYVSNVITTADVAGVKTSTFVASTDADTRKGHNLFEILKQKLHSLFNDQQHPACKYLDSFKSIAEDNLKLLNDQDTKPVWKGSGGSRTAVELMMFTKDDKAIHVAVKSFEYDDAASRNEKKQINDRLASEVKFLDMLRNIPEIPEVFGVYKNQKGYHIVMEFLGDETTNRPINLAQAFVSESKDGFRRRSYAKDVMWLDVLLDTAKAIHEMHVRGVLHCNIDPKNILLYINDQQRVAGKLIDFGLACLETKPRRFTLKTANAIDNDVWYAPELDNISCWGRSSCHSKASDVWDFGQMLTSISGVLTPRTKSKILGLLVSCTRADPKARASSKHIISELECAILRIRNNYLKHRRYDLI